MAIFGIWEVSDLRTDAAHRCDFLRRLFVAADVHGTERVLEPAEPGGDSSVRGVVILVGEAPVVRAAGRIGKAIPSPSGLSQRQPENNGNVGDSRDFRRAGAIFWRQRKGFQRHEPIGPDTARA